MIINIMLYIFYEQTTYSNNYYGHIVAYYILAVIIVTKHIFFILQRVSGRNRGHVNQHRILYWDNLRANGLLITVVSVFYSIRVFNSHILS